MNLKSERLKKLENELNDLEQWLKLGLVPKKDIPKHEEEIEAIKEKIDAERERLRFLKESGEVEEYVPPKRNARPAYQEPQSMPDMAVGAGAGTGGGNSETNTAEGNTYAGETENYESETATGETTSADITKEEEDTSSQVYADDDDPFSDKNRWKRGILEDPDADNW